MREKEKKLTHGRLVETVTYDASSGIFTWRESHGRCGAGALAGYIHVRGHRFIKLDGAQYDALRLAYFYAQKNWPEGAVLPADGDNANACLANLRVVPEISAAEFPGLRSDLTVELIRKLFFYEGGRLLWAVQYGSLARFGMEAGSAMAKGYRTVSIGGNPYQVHRIAWAHARGELLNENEQIDHINGDTTDNRIENLRKATRSQNVANSKPRTNSFGVPGISTQQSGSFKVHCNQRYIGTFKKLNEAIAARRNAEAEYQGEFAYSQRYAANARERQRPSSFAARNPAASNLPLRLC